MTKRFKAQVDLSGLQATTCIDEYVQKAIEHMSGQIDFEVMCDLHDTWTRVEVPNNDQLFDWVYNNQNIKGGAHGFDGHWIFELPADANWFVLRWSGK
jgi:DNA-binding protein Fis